jgi:hypothetical protein
MKADMPSDHEVPVEHFRPAQMVLIEGLQYEVIQM